MTLGDWGFATRGLCRLAQSSGELLSTTQPGESDGNIYATTSVLFTEPLFKEFQQGD